MKMNSKSLLILAGALSCHLTASAATIEQLSGWVDGDGGIVTSADIAFDVVNSDSILVASMYVDGTADITAVTFGGVAPDASFADDRTFSYLFLNPSTASGLNFSVTKNDTGGLAAILYEVTGAVTDLSSITTVTASNTITTTASNELIVAFGGRNNAAATEVAGSSIFTGEDLRTNTLGGIRGGGSLASASAIAPTAGSQNISWTSATEGRIAHSFQAIPEPSTFALISAFGLLFSARRRRL